MNEKLCAWHITYLLREEQGTYKLTFGYSCGAWSRKIYMKTILCEATKGTKSVEMSQGWAMPMIWAYCFPLSSSYVNYSFVSSSIQQRVVRGSESTCMNLMMKNAPKQDIIYSNHTFRKSSIPSFWSGQVFSWHAPSALALWSRREERQSHLPGHMWAQRSEGSPDRTESTLMLAEASTGATPEQESPRRLEKAKGQAVKN